MALLVAKVILGLLAIHMAIGGVFGAWLMARGLRRIDPAAHVAPLSFKILILPGIVALWPLLLRAARRGVDPLPGTSARALEDREPPDWARGARRRHRLVWLALALLLPLGFAAGLLARPETPAQSPTPARTPGGRP